MPLYLAMLFTRVFQHTLYENPRSERVTWRCAFSRRAAIVDRHLSKPGVCCIQLIRLFLSLCHLVRPELFGFSAKLIDSARLICVYMLLLQNPFHTPEQCFECLHSLWFSHCGFSLASRDPCSPWFEIRWQVCAQKHPLPLIDYVNSSLASIL